MPPWGIIIFPPPILPSLSLLFLPLLILLWLFFFLSLSLSQVEKTLKDQKDPGEAMFDVIPCPLQHILAHAHNTITGKMYLVWKSCAHTTQGSPLCATFFVKIVFFYKNIHKIWLTYFVLYYDFRNRNGTSSHWTVCLMVLHYADLQEVILSLTNISVAVFSMC